MSSGTEMFDEPATSEAERPALGVAEYWAVLVKHRVLIAACILAGLAVSAVISVSTRPSYKASTVLTVEKERLTPLDADWRPQVYSGPDPDFLPTQMRLMRSREVVERAVDKLELAREPAIVSGAKGILPLRKSPDLRPDAARRRAIAAVRSGIEVAPVRGTSLVELSYIGPSPKLAATVANGLAEAYIAWNLQAKFQLVDQASEFLKAQIEQLQREITGQEQQLLAYGRRKDILSGDPAASVTVQKLEAFNTDYAAAVADRVAKEARYHSIQNARPDSVADTLSGFVSQLRAEQSRMEREYAEKLNLYKPEWPAMRQLKTQIDEGRRNLNAVIQETVTKAREVARNEYLTALRREQSLSSVMRSQKSEAQAMNSSTVEYGNLQGQLNNKKTLLDSLVKRQAETEILSRLSGERSSNVRIVDRALPPGGRFKPSYQQNGIAGLIGGALLGVGLAFLLSYLDRSLRTPQQVEQYLRLPALGVVPSVSSDAKGAGYFYGSKLRRKKSDEPPPAIELLPHTHQRSRIAERYRTFRTALLLSRAGGLKSIVVTSAFAREGKTATAVNLAVVLAQLGKRVLLVDADLHKPRLHEVLGVSNRTGLVSILAENLEPARAIVKTELPDLYVVPSGPSSPNPSGLLSSEGMTRFLELSCLNFDYVVLDAPPVVPLADAILIGYQADGVVLCVQGGHTPREQVLRARDKLQRSGVRILGVLLNNVPETSDEYQGYDYYDSDYVAPAAAEPARAATTARSTL
jgi:capsular exopolysaccharide synthesis family protein